MSRVLLTTRLGFFSRLTNVWLLAAVDEGRSTEDSPTDVPEKPATVDVREVKAES